MAKKESVLSAEEKASLKIEKFIFHIIVKGDVNPTYLDELDLVDDQIAFFTQRLVDVSEGVQHVFKDKDNSSFYKDCCSIIEDPLKNFVEISKKLTASFKEHHKKTANDGVFITALVEITNSQKLLFFLKLDHRKVYEYTLQDKKALLKEIKKTFVEDKRAIQKAALVDTSGSHIWDILATDRTATGNLALRSYFSSFLTAIERETPSVLTVRAVSSIRPWVLENTSDIDPGRELALFKQRAIDYLNGTPTFNSKAFIKAVVQDSDPDKQRKLRRSFSKYCDDKGLSGQSFQPNVSSLDRSLKKHIRKTEEGVRIEWEGDAAAHYVTIPTEKNRADGMFHIVIKTTSQIQILDK